MLAVLSKALIAKATFTESFLVSRYRKSKKRRKRRRSGRRRKSKRPDGTETTCCQKVLRYGEVKEERAEEEKFQQAFRN